jgi:hypothetical protein
MIMCQAGTNQLPSSITGSLYAPIDTMQGPMLVYVQQLHIIMHSQAAVLHLELLHFDDTGTLIAAGTATCC